MRLDETLERTRTTRKAAAEMGFSTHRICIPPCSSSVTLRKSLGNAEEKSGLPCGNFRVTQSCLQGCSRRTFFVHVADAGRDSRKVEIQHLLKERHEVDAATTKPAG